MPASMTFLMLIVSGAILFFAAGYLLRLLVASEKGPAKKQLADHIVRLEMQLDEALVKAEKLENDLANERDSAALKGESFAQLSEENERLSAELITVMAQNQRNAAMKKETDKGELQKLENKISSLKRELGESEKQVNRNKVSLDISKEEVKKLKKELRFLKKSESSAKESDRRLEEMAEKVKEAESKVVAMAKLEKENRYLRKEVQHLSTQSIAKGVSAVRTSKTPIKGATLSLRKAFDKEMKAVVADLLELEQVHSAVVADTDGALVGGVGNEAQFERLAALCGQVGEIGEKTDQTVLLKGLRVAHLKDQKDGIAAFRLFSKNKETYVLGTIGSNSPPGEGILELTVADLSDE